MICNTNLIQKYISNVTHCLVQTRLVLLVRVSAVLQPLRAGFRAQQSHLQPARLLRFKLKHLLYIWTALNMNYTKHYQRICNT